MTDSVVHFEIPVDDVERAKSFYSKVFGWSIQSPSPSQTVQYHLVRTTAVDPTTQRPTQPGAINGGLLKRSPPIVSIVVTLQVADLEESLRLVKRSGGTIVHPKTPVGTMGFSAYVRDPEGNVVGLFQPGARPG